MMQSLYHGGRYYCAGCHRYKDEPDVRKVDGRGARLYCVECGQQVRYTARTTSKPAKESRLR